MERNKSNNCVRGHKKVAGPVGNEFFPLGAKSTREDPKHKVPTSKTSNIADRKREASSSISNVNKKPRLSRSSGEACGNIVQELWEQMAIDCEVVELLDGIYSILDEFEDENVLRLMCGSIKHFIEPYSRMKFDTVLYLAILFIAKLRPAILRIEVISSALVYVLRRDSNLKLRQSCYSHVLASNLLTKGYNERQNWPELFLRLYIDDAINERVWADNELCMPFINNICSAFRTTAPLNTTLQQENVSFGGVSSGPHRDVPLGIEDDSGDSSIQGIDPNVIMHIFDVESDTSTFIRNRFIDNEHIVKKYVVDAIKDQLNKRQQPDCYTRNILKFLCSTAGLDEVRCISVTRLELWIHNGKLVKLAQQLLSYICVNIRANNCKDHEILSLLVKIRLKSKPFINFYMICIKEMIMQQPDILCIILKLVVQNELSNTRNPNNMGMIATMFQTSPDQSSSHLAEIYKEYLLQREDCLRTLRVFLRELIRILRFDMNIKQFCKVFLNDRLDLMEQIERSDYRDRIFHSMVDLVCLCMLLSVSPQIREACILLRSTRDIKSNPMLIQFYSQISTIQLDAISWMYEIVPKLFKLQNAEYNQALHKLLLLDNPEQYSRCDQWPSEPERGTLLRIISETPVREETLLRIILIGITKENPFTIPDTIDIIMMVIKRASTMRITNCPAVQTNKYDIIDFLFSMVEYHYPENIKLPVDYNPPKFAIITLYWKAWLIMLMISAHNPSTFGAFCWEHYPTMKHLIEMCITNQFQEQMTVKDELQIISMERDRILQFETYLAAQTSQTIITEENAILISQLILMDPLGPARRIPTAVLDQIKNLNKTLKLGNLLCRCRKPDLLLDIIQRQGTTKSMPWLSDLVQNCEGDFSHLPVQCLCEFLLFNAHAINEENSRESDLISYIRNLIMENNSNNKIVCEVLDYIFRRLSSTVNFSRNAALRGLKIIFKCSPKEENDWLLRSIPQVPSFREICSFVIPQLRSACQVENSPKLVMLYIEFVAAHTIHNSAIEMLDHVIDMAQLIVERSTMFQHIIPSSVEILFTESVQDNLYENRFQTLKCLFVMFNNYVIKLREHQEPFDWTEYPDLIMVQFDDGVQLPLHLNIIHAFIILLTYSSNRMPESIPILDYWFPPGRTAPNAFLPNLPQETVQLLPDWLKLKMIRSSVDRLVEAALYDLTPDQIVLFVQNFGTPVNSMSKLLALLDHAVNEQFDAVRDAILNKAYLAQLIEIQQVRGAKNGHFTVKVLGLHSHSQTVPDLPKLNNEVLKSFSFSNNRSTMTSSMFFCKSIKDVEDIICAIFKCRHLNPINSMRFRKVIHQLLQRGQNANNVFNKKKFSHGLVRIIDRFKTLVLFQNKSQRNHVCTLIRALLRYGAILFDGGHPILQIINDFEPLLTKKISFSENQISYYHLSLFLILQKPKNSLREVWIQPNSSINKKYRWISDIIENSSEVLHTCDICHDGLLVDHLCEINPELRNFNREKQFINLLLNKYKDFRFYLLSLICHQTNWETVIYILQYFILHSHTTVDCSIVLNFIEALINNPKLWQGRQDKIMSKANLSEKLFSLNKDELNAFTEYILKEGEVEIETLEKYDFKLCSRINLVLRVISRNKNDLLTFIKNVFRNCCPELLKLKVIYQIYLLYPSIVYFANNTKDHIIKLQTLKGCKADKVSNYLITCLGNLLLKKDFEALSSDTEILIRKFAASHPALFLRQLGVLSSLVEGRAQLNSRVLRDEYHFHRFVQILRTMQVLEPMIFDDTYKTDFQALLRCYFMFLKHHSYVKETYHILIKFVELLQAYININPATALLYIEHYVGILMELSAKFNSILQLQQLVQGIALLQQKNLSENQLSEGELKQDFDFEEQNDIKTTTNVSIVSEAEIAEAGAIHQLETNKKGTVSFALTSTLHKCSTLSNHYMDLIKIIKLSNSEDSILNPLQEIESFTSKRFSLLSEIFDRLLELIFSTRAQIRSNAFILLIRHLKHNPGHSDTSRCALNAYIQCLRDDNSSVATTAVDNLVEITLLLQEHAVEILSVAFSLGVKSRINTSIQIKRVLQTLMLQHGY